VLIGEIRDKETAQIAIQAALTGHLVLSTLHTNDAANAVTRLTDIGIEGYKIATALRGVIAQRLMRRLCPTCKEVWVEAIPAKLHQWLPPDTPVYRAAGCSECAMTGYRGRFSIVEVLANSPEVERRIGAGETADRIAEAARIAGMKSLWDSGLKHVLTGESTIDELLRVVDVPQEEAERSSGSQRPVSTRTSDARGVARVSGAVATPQTPAPTPASPRPSLGLKQADAVPVPGEDLSSSFDLIESSKPPELTRGGREPQATVLLVDDEDQLRRVMKDLLEREGYRVTEAQNGIEALDQVDRHAPDIVVLDLNLPGLDGYGVLSHLRSRPATAKIPVVVLTARGDEDNEVRVLELGADDFLSKPFRARALSARLKTILSRRYGSRTTY
jgi:CheY-like chemotaxis protein